MSHRLGAAFACLGLALAVEASPADDLSRGLPGAPPASLTEVSPEAARFFESLVRRYRELVRYADVSWFEQVISGADPSDATTSRSRVRVEGRIADGRVEVISTATRLLEALLPSDDHDAGGRSAADRRRARRDVDAALAPHLGLRLLDQPLRELRPEGLEEYRPTSLRTVELDDRPMLRLELRSGGDTPGEPSAILELTIDPESMLIRRVEGEERWPDGRTCSTSIEIEPRRELIEPAMDPSAPTDAGTPAEPGGLPTLPATTARPVA